jgi:hypothetical protein
LAFFGSLLACFGSSLNVYWDSQKPKFLYKHSAAIYLVMEPNMITTDKFLTGIVLGIVLLVLVAFAAAFLRPQPSYQPEDTPEGIVHNYLLAMQQEDFERAYSYLSPAIEGYPPTLEAFTQYIWENPWEFRLSEDTRTREVEVVSSRVTGKRVAVTVLETYFYQGGLFDSNQYTNTFEIRLEREASSNAWKIVEAESYWFWCWSDKDACP